MQPLIFTNPITINNINYNIEEIDTSTLIKAKGQIVKTISKSKVFNSKGVYIFVLKSSLINFNINYFSSEITGVFFKQKCPYTKEIGVPPFVEKPQKDCIFYVGSAGQIVSRLKEHWNNEKINGCSSLKLGFKSRKWIRDFLKVYIITSCCNKNLPFDHKQLEKDIRNIYGAAFGE